MGPQCASACIGAGPSTYCFLYMGRGLYYPVAVCSLSSDALMTLTIPALDGLFSNTQLVIAVAGSIPALTTIIPVVAPLIKALTMPPESTTLDIVGDNLGSVIQPAAGVCVGVSVSISGQPCENLLVVTVSEWLHSPLLRCYWRHV